MRAPSSAARVYLLPYIAYLFDGVRTHKIFAFSCHGRIVAILLHPMPRNIPRATGMVHRACLLKKGAVKDYICRVGHMPRSYVSHILSIYGRQKLDRNPLALWFCVLTKWRRLSSPVIPNIAERGTWASRKRQVVSLLHQS
jgi:hypothetical protein